VCTRVRARACVCACVYTYTFACMYMYVCIDRYKYLYKAHLSFDSERCHGRCIRNVSHAISVHHRASGEYIYKSACVYTYTFACMYMYVCIDRYKYLYKAHLSFDSERYHGRCIRNVSHAISVHHRASGEYIYKNI